jgi:hypothetical protein
MPSFSICSTPHSIHYDGLDVWPLEEFLRRLYQGEVF